MENKNFEDVIGNPAAPYINALAMRFGLPTQYFAVAHPSLPNYMALTGGRTLFRDDCEDCVVLAENLADQIEASGRTWKAYMEGMPHPCATTNSGSYSQQHNPFIHYRSVVAAASRCASHVVPFTEFEKDRLAGTLPNFVWITPDLCSDTHDCGIEVGDTWLATVVPQLLDATAFAHGVVFLVWDEGREEEGSGGGHVPLLVLAPSGIPGQQSSAPANHYSVLRTIQDAWGLAALGEAAEARVLSEYFR